ncbi:UNVERIFIED_ORG: hypothetical protein QE446_002475 [Rhizobium sp. SORGH_AS260]|nr:hypothetical protein [Rhizobium sp. SORGH_AS_0285]MDP9754599.1 hypothetical protein [Rhizobium sp. SORGH_AS_0260]MDR6082748.1 hypothetical protein [Agrobacterium sp. SORGH_AS_0440]
MLAAGQYGATSFAANPRRMDRSVGSLPISCPCKDADIPPIRLSSSTGLRAGLFFVGMWRAIIELAAAKHPQASSFRPYPKIRRLCHRRQPDDKPHSVFDVILGLVPSICRRIANSGVADARDRPEHDGGDAFKLSRQPPTARLNRNACNLTCGYAGRSENGSSGWDHCPARERWRNICSYPI